MTDSKDTKKKAESSSSSSKEQAAPSTDVETDPGKLASALYGPSTADLNPAYNAAVQEEADQQDK